MTSVPGDLGGFLDQLADLVAARVVARLRDGGAPAPAGGDNRLLDVPTAARLLGVKPRWLYRHWKSLPFARRLPGGAGKTPRLLRFDEEGLRQWMAAGGRRSG